MKNQGDIPSAQPSPEPIQNGISAVGDLNASHDSPEPSPEVLQILEEYMTELENGRRPNVDEFVARHPSLGKLGDHLRGYLASLDFLHPQAPPAARPLEIQLEDEEDLPPPNPALGRLGDFNLVREIGRGGMGIVYEAVQISLRRRVALKVLPMAAALDTKQLQRFKNEALAAAGLHHPQIVPIHAVGTERGVHYYAMQLIEGHSLADVIIDLRGQMKAKNENRELRIRDRRPGGGDRGPMTENGASELTLAGSTVQDRLRADDTPIDSPGFTGFDPQSPIPHPPSSILNPSSSFFQNVARLGIQAAEALAHAHRLGIVHRDIKPANLILDDEGKLWVTDFGLAMMQSNMELTATGDVVGTLRYMSPEQAAAKRGLIDQRTDIYSLGATLYELLTLEPAFTDKDRHQLLARIAMEDPRAPRRLNPAIPKDLETIVLKSMAKSPPERYLTAEEMAEDLKRYMDDQPIRATRPSIPERALRWGRRHKALVAGCTIFSMASVLMAAILFYEAKRQAYEKKVHEQQLILAQREKLMENLVAIHEAMDELCLKPALERLAKNSDSQKQREDQEFLRKVLVHYQRFADLNFREAGPRALPAYAGRQVGNILQALGDPAHANEAKEAYEKAIALLVEVIADNPQDPALRAELARSRNGLGNVLWTNSQPDLAEKTLAQETKELEQAVVDFPQVTDFRNELVNCRQNLSLLLGLTGQTHQAEAVLRENLPILEDLTSANPCRPDYQKTKADNLCRLGDVLKVSGQSKESEKFYLQAEEILERLLAQEPKTTEYKQARAIVAYNLGLLCREAGRLPDSEKAYQRSIGVSKALVGEFPLIPDYGLELAMEEHQLGLTLAQMQKYAEAESAYRHAEELLERLVRDFPAKQRYQEEFACCSNNFGIYFEKTHVPAEAENSYARAARLLEDLAKRFPRMLDYHSDLGGARFSQARLLADRNENEKACKLLEQAIEHQRIAIQGNPRNPQYYAPLWPQYQLLLKLLMEDGKIDQINLVLQGAREKCKDLPSILNNLAWWMVRHPQPPFGNATLGLQFAKQATEKSPSKGDLWNTLGTAQYRLGNWQEAVAALEKSRTLRSGGDSYDFFFLAMTHWQLGEKDQARDSYQKAIAKLPKDKNEELRRIQEEAEKLLGVSSVSATNSKKKTVSDSLSTDR
jgi:serine/threonine protein kinase